MLPLEKLVNSQGMKAAYNREMWADYAGEHKGDFLAYLRFCIDDYVSKIAQNDPSVESNKVSVAINEQVAGKFDILKSIAGGVTESVRWYLDGKPNRAYESLVSSLKNSPDLLKSSAITFIQNGQDLELDFFRLRVSESKRDVISRENIFHVPFQKRGSIHSNRYSIPGFPCLYLGSSLYTCWEEMNRPNFDKIFFSRFSILRDKLYSTVFFDVGYDTPAMLRGKFESLCNDWESLNDDMRRKRVLYLVNRLVTWPLTLACSIPTIDEDSAFYPEYIVPQLLMQCITENNEYQAILYRTTAVPAENYLTPLPLLLNFAFPAKTIKPEGFCDALMSLFNLTEPISWELALSSCTDPPNGSSYASKAISEYHNQLLDIQFSPIRNMPYNYRESVFGKLQCYSMAYPSEPLQEEQPT